MDFSFLKIAYFGIQLIDFALFCSTVAGVFIAKKPVTKRLLRVITSKLSEHDKELCFEAFMPTTSLLFFVLGADVARYLLPLSAETHYTVGLLFDQVLFVILCWFLYRGIDLWWGRKQKRQKLKDKLIPREFQALAISSGKIVAMAVVLSVLSLLFDTSVFNVLGSVGVALTALGFIVQDMVRNWVGSFILIKDEAFKGGDRIKIGDIEGDVMELRLRSTTLRQSDGAIVMIPNAQLVGGPLTNYSKVPYRRIRLQLSLSLETSTEQLHAVMTAIHAWLKKYPNALPEPAPIVQIESMDDYAITLLCAFFVRRPKFKEYVQDREAFLLALKNILEEESVSVATQEQSVFVELRGSTAKDFLENTV